MCLIDCHFVKQHYNSKTFQKNLIFYYVARSHHFIMYENQKIKMC